MALNSPASIQFLSRPVIAGPEERSEYIGLANRLKRWNSLKVLPHFLQAQADRFSELQDLMGHSRLKANPAWLARGGEALFSTGAKDDIDSSGRYISRNGHSVRAWRSGPFIDIAEFENGLPSGHAWRIHEREWPASPLDQLALLRLSNPNMLDDNVIEQGRNSMNELAEGHPGIIPDWSLKLDLEDPDLLKTVAPETAQAMDYVISEGAVFSVGRMPDWTLNQDDYLGQFDIRDLTAEDETALLEIAGKNLPAVPEKKRGSGLIVVAAKESPDTLIAFGARQYFRQNTWEDGVYPVAIRHQGMLHIFDGSRSEFESIRDRLGPAASYSKSCRDKLEYEHSNIVKNAVKKRLPVPEDVLADYPGIRLLQAPNLSGDQRPVPVFDEADMVSFFSHPEHSEIYGALLDQKREILNEDYYLMDDLMFRARKMVIESYSEDIFKSDDQLIEIAESADYADEIREQEIADFLKEHDLAGTYIDDLTESQRDDLEDRIRDELIDRCKSDAVSECDPNDDAWDWEDDHATELFYDQLYELEYEVTDEALAAGLADTKMLIATDADEIVSYTIIANSDGDFVLYRGDADNPVENYLDDFPSFAEAAEAGVKHARLGFVPHTWPLNEPVSDRAWQKRNPYGRTLRVASGDRYDAKRVSGWERGNFAVVPLTSKQPGFQTLHFQTGMPVGPVWANDQQAKRFADLLVGKIDWASLDLNSMEGIVDLVRATEKQAKQEARENDMASSALHRLQRSKSAAAEFASFSGPVHFSANLLDINPPRFSLENHSGFKPTDIDEQWMLDRIRETAFESSIAEEWLDIQIENYIPATETVRQLGAATVFNWHTMSLEDQQATIEAMKGDDEIKADLIFTDMADEFDNHLKEIVSAELEHYASATVLHDLDGQGFRLIFNHEDPTSMEVFAPGPISEETFLGYARGETVDEAMKDGEDICGQFTLLGRRAINHGDLFKQLNPYVDSENWQNRVIILSETLTGLSSRLARGFARKSFGIVKTDWHLGMRQPGYAIIHLATGLPIKPFFRKDQDALGFARLLEVQADWKNITDHATFARKSKELRDIAHNSSMAILDLARERDKPLRKNRNTPTEPANAFAGAVAFKVDNFRHPEYHEMQVRRLIEGADPSRSPYQKWDDFLTLASCAYRGQSMPKASDAWRENESRYLDVVDRYRKNSRLEDIRNAYPEALGHLVLAAQKSGDDTLGKLHQEIDPNHHLGQYFTPYPVARLMAEMTSNPVSETGMRTLEEGRGYIDVHDPACGAGVMALAQIDAYRDQNIDPSQHLRVHLTDLDHRAADMAYINMAVRNIPAVVTHGNSLTQEVFSRHMTPAYVNARFKDIQEKRKSVGQSITQQAGLFDHTSYSVGQNYSDLSASLLKLGAGPDLLDHQFVPANDPREGERTGEAARMNLVISLLNAANNTFHEAEQLGLGTPHPDRDHLPLRQLNDEYHQQLGAQINRFIENMPMMLPTTRANAASMLGYLREYEDSLDDYINRFGEPEQTFEALTTPRWKVADQLPEFGPEDEMRILDQDFPDEDAIEEKVRETYSFYERQVRGEYLSRFGHDFEIDERLIAQQAGSRKQDALEKLVRDGREVDDASVDEQARKLVLLDMRSRGLQPGDIDEKQLLAVHGEAVFNEAEERARDMAITELVAASSLTIEDRTGLGYTIRNHPGDIAYSLFYQQSPLAVSQSFNEARTLAIAHAQGKDIDALRKPDLPLNPNGPSDRFLKRNTVFYSSKKIDPSLFSIGRLVDPSVYGHFAVSKDLKNRPGWYITHLPTGYTVNAVGKRFANEEVARECVQELELMGNWNILRSEIDDWMQSEETREFRDRAYGLLEEYIDRAANQVRSEARGRPEPRSDQIFGSTHTPVFKTGLPESLSSEQTEKLSRYIALELDGTGFENINALRRFAAEKLDIPIPRRDVVSREIEEIAERVLVRKGSELYRSFSGPLPELLDRLNDLQNKLPPLATRTSSSSELQAYSTPLPIAGLAARLLDAKEGEIVYDPTAGNGALLIGQAPDNRIANELDPSRARHLEARTVTGSDAVTTLPEKAIDHLIANPPFGTLDRASYGTLFLDENGISPNRTPGSLQVATRNLHEAIVWNALTSLPDEGKAVLILPSVRGDGDRNKGYREAGRRRFFWKLYSTFNVTDHVTLSGDLYRQQGAGWPIDLIVIEGKGRSLLPLPAQETPPLIRSFDQLKEICHDLDTNFSRHQLVQPSGISGYAKLRANGKTPVRDSAVPGRDDESIPAHLSDRPSREIDSDRSDVSGSAHADLSVSANPGTGSYAAGNDRPSGIPGMVKSAALDTAGITDQRNSGSPEISGSGRSNAGAGSMSETLVPYKPLSGAKALETLIPANLANGFEKAKENLVQAVGNVDEYVQTKLGYKSKDELYKALAAEQIDAVAFAIHQDETGGSFINGHLMGIGKGRVAAAMIVYYHLTGRTPIFFTERPNLYPAIMRDLADIGYGHLRPLITNDGLTGAKALELPDGRTLSTPDKAKHDAELIRIRDQGHLGKDYDFLMTSWSQTQTVNGQETLRRMLLRRLAPNAGLVRDEVHNAGGQEDLFKQPGPANRAEFARELMWDARGVYDSSGTWAKTSGTMDLFGRTDLRHAVQDPKEIGEVIARHGLPMQQMVASMLSEAGQYMRLERSMEGIDYDFSVVNVDTKRFDRMAEILEAIAEFDQAKHDLLKGELGQQILAAGQAALPDNATGEVGINSTNFSSLLHNISSQAELSLTADAVADHAIEALKNGEKPFITLANTMGSFLSQFASDNELTPGDTVDVHFGDVLRRYLERSRDVTVGTPFSTKERFYLEDHQLGDAKKLYDKVIRLIEAADWSNMPVSPIDHVKARIEKAGFTMGEFTGRSEGIDYSSDKPVYYRRSASDRSKAADVRTERGFNDGSIDAAIGNESVASGITLSANANFADQRPRLDITWQAHPNVEKHVQIKFRVNRTGQVVKPRYLHLLTDIPASRRNAANLERKLRSLNANTTANQKGLFQSGGVDMLNEIGDRAAATVMENNPVIHRRFGYPLKLAEGARGLETKGAARKVTGRMIMLPVALQKKLYDEFDTEFAAEMNRAERLGLLKDDAKVLDLEARIVSRAQLDKSIRAQSPFGGPVFLNEMNVRNLERPWPYLRVLAEINHTLGRDETTPIDVIRKEGRDQAKALKERIREQFDRYSAASIERASDRRKSAVRVRLEGDLDRFNKLLDNFPIGRSVMLTTPEGKQIYGIVGGMVKRGAAVNPVSPAAWTIRLYVADGAREIDLRLNELALPGEKPLKSDYVMIKADQAAIAIDGKLEMKPISEVFDRLSVEDRENRLIATGNILGAADRFRDARVTYYTTENGKIEPGLILPRDADVSEVLSRAPVAVTKPAHIKTLLGKDVVLSSMDNNLVISQLKDQIELRASRGRSAGGKYWLDRDIREFAGDFVSSGTSMVANVPANKLTELVNLLEAKRISLLARSDLSVAREVTGEVLPSMEKRKLRKPDGPLQPGQFIMPWELRGETTAPFAQAVQFSTGRPVELMEDDSGKLQAVRHVGAPGPQPDGARIHRILNVPDYLSVNQLMADLHLESDQGRFVHRFDQVYYSTGAQDNGLTVYSDAEMRDLPRHHSYDIWAQRRGAPPAGWQEADVPLLSPNGPVRYPGFVSDTAPGLAVVPFPRPGLRPGNYDRDSLRFVVLHKESGQALLPGKRFMYTAQGASEAASQMASKFDFKNMVSPEEMGHQERAHANLVVQNAYEGARPADRDAYIEFNLKNGVTPEFQGSDVYWLAMDDASDPDIDAAAETAQTSGVFYLYPDRDSALDSGLADAAPVRARLGKLAKLTDEVWSGEVREITRAFFEMHEDGLRMGLSTSFYEMASDYEEVQDRIEAGEDEDTVIEAFVEERMAQFDYDAFEDAVRRQDYRAAGAYDGDLKDALMAWLSEKFDGAELWSLTEFDKKDLVLFNARDVELAWDQLETSIEIARQERHAAETRREEWNADRGEQEVERLRLWKTEQIDTFDLAVLQERGFNVNDIHWLSVPNKEYPELEKAYGKQDPVLFTRRTDAEAEGSFKEAVPVYLRRGQGVDLTSDTPSSREFVSQLAQLTEIDQAELRGLPGGNIDKLQVAVQQLVRAKGLDYVQYVKNNIKQTILSDTSDITVAWDAIQRKSLHRRTSDIHVGPALAAAKAAAALEAPRLLLTGPDGREAAEQDARSTSIFMQAEEVRGLAGNDALLIFVEGEQAQIFDRDALRAHNVIASLPLIEIGDIAQIELPSGTINEIVEQLAVKYRVVVARLDANGDIQLENHAGSQVEIETLNAADAADPRLRDEREKKRARHRAGSWAEKPIADRYADLHLAARNKEVPALADGDRYVIAGHLARILSDDIGKLRENFDKEADLTWFGKDDVGELTAALAAIDKRLMLAEGLSRATWKQARVSGSEETRTVEEIAAETAQDRHAELAARHPDRVIFVEDGEGFRTFGENVETIARRDPHLTSKFERVHDIPSIAITREEMDYQARQMAMRGLKVTIAKSGPDGAVDIRNIDPQAEIVRDSDISQAISGENKESALAAPLRTIPDQDRDTISSDSQSDRLTDLIVLFDQQKSANPEAVILIEQDGEFVLFDGDARLVARHFEPVRNRLAKFKDHLERDRVTGRLNANVLDRAIEQLRNRSINLVVLKKNGDDYFAESHAATRTQPDYPAIARDAAARRGFDLSRKAYAPVTGTGAFEGRPLIDGVVFYIDPIAAGTNSLEIHYRLKNPARLGSTDLAGYNWRAPLQKMFENLREAYGLESVEQLRDIIADGRTVSWWASRLEELGIGGDPMDMQRSIFSDLKRLGYDGAIMLDANGYEMQVAFDPETVIPVRSVSLTRENSQNPGSAVTGSVQSTSANRFGNVVSSAQESSFVPNRFGFDGLKLAYQATPQNREELKHVLDEITRAFDSEESTGDKRSSYLREMGLLNGTLAGRINRYTDEVHPISPGYVLYPGDNGKWVYATIRDFVSATGPRGSLYGRWAPEMSDQISDYAAFYLNQLDAAFEPQLARVKEELTELVGEINPDVDLRFVDRLFADGTIEGNPDRQPVLGLYFRHTDAMPISTDISKGDPRLTGLHELYHSLVPLLTREEQQVVMSGFGGEEKAAEAFAQWALGTREGQRLGPLRNLYERMNNILRGNGFRSWQDVFRQTRTGEVARRAKVLEMSSDLSVDMARTLAEAANLPALGDAIVMYGRRLKSDMIPMETVYQMMAQHLDDMEITRAATRAGYHRINDEQNISSIPATRQNTIALDLARHQKLTPIDIGSSDPYIARRSEQGTPAQARRSPAGVRPLPSMRRRMEQPRVIRYKTSAGEILQNNSLEDTSTKSPLVSNIKDIMLQDANGQLVPKSAQYLQHNAFIVNNGGTLDMIELAGQETTIPMATRGSANIIDANARPLYVVPSDMDALVERQIVGSDERGLHFDAVSGAYYVSLDHPEIEYLLENFGTIEAQRKWLEHRNQQESGIAETLSEFQVIARQVPEADRLYIYPIGESEVQMARLQGARFDERADYRLYYLDKNSIHAEALSKRFGSSPERLNRYADWREKQFNEKIRRQHVAYIDTAESQAELGPDVVRKIGRSALFSAGIGAAAAAATRAQAAEAPVHAVPTAPLAPEAAGEIESIFERMGDGQWREIVSNSSVTNSAQELWQSLSRDTQQFFETMAINAGPSVALAKELISEKFDRFYSTLTAFPEKLADSSSADEFFSHVKSQFYTDMHTLGDFAASAGETVRNIPAPDVSFAPGLVDLKSKVVDQTLPALKAQVAGTMDSWMQGAKALAQPTIDVMQNALGPKVTAAVAAIGGTAGLTAIASGAATAGTIGAGVAAATYMARRGERRKMWADDSREMPWKLTSRQFGQVFKKHYAVERQDENGVETVSLKRKESGETIFKTAAPLGAKVSARELVQAAHGAMVDKAIEQKLPVPDHVKLSVVEARSRNTGPGYANIETGYLGAGMGDEMRKSYVEKVPSVVAGTDTKGLSEQLTRLPLNTLASASLKTAQAESLTTDPGKKAQLSKGMGLLQTEIVNRARKTAELRLTEGVDQKQKTAQRAERAIKPVKRKGRGI
ncbi:strawberry notch C-terminal domain-containing protein [Thalassospira xiamenensis]|uniref:strawberry notch C-terminal domain-containing protein n=1 Tax=Thalassospira xiamenensis TaxID=220697 RepID=UPI000DED5D43|nr:strawberry notch C-terminal domain-containing protein [Thalassospira xiamenensis]RCK34590.1 hypothetical protein TH24_20560 [Thalassospira xiamenensis]